MKKVLLILLLLTVVFATGLGAGYAAAFYLYFRSGNASQQILDSDRIALDVELLGFLRIGDVKKALFWLERDLDRTATALPQGRAFAELPSEVQRSLLMVRGYHRFFPSTGRYAAKVVRVLNDVPEPSKAFYESCGEGLRQLAHRSSEDDSSGTGVK